MRRILENSLAVWLGASLLFHAVLAVAIWNSSVTSSWSARAEPERIAVRLVAPRPSKAEPPAVSAASPPALAPPERSVPVVEQRQSSPKPRPTSAQSSSRPIAPPIAPPVESTEVAVASPRPEAQAAESPIERPRAVTADPAPSAEPVRLEAEAFEQDVDPLPRYVALVRARVDAQKRYPAMARQRSEEGLVLARLSIGPDGRLEGLEVDRGGPLLLRRATRAAVEAAAPFAMPPGGSVLIEIPVRWRVQR